MTGISGARIRERDRNTILQSLRAGMVPRTGQHHFQVGRVNEIETLVTDLDNISNGGAGFRFVIGDYGSGKTFFLQLVRSIALQKNLVTAHADLTPERRLHGTGGQARSLYAELMRNIATRSSPEGGAMETIVGRFVTIALQQAHATNTQPEDVIDMKLAQMSELTGGYDFARVIGSYWIGHDSGNQQLKLDAIRWLRAEFTTVTEARQALGVRSIITDSNFYDSLKLLSTFVILAGYKGLLIGLDEMVNLFKIVNTVGRNANYEQLLRMVNDSTQGITSHLGFLFAGTPDFLMDTRRGVYSYAALQSRLQENTFSNADYVDYSGPVLRLSALAPEDFFILLKKLRYIHNPNNNPEISLPDSALYSFMEHCSSRIGDSYFRTPRTTIKTFLDLLAILDQHPDLQWTDLLAQTSLTSDVESPDESATDIDDELKSFKL